LRTRRLTEPSGRRVELTKREFGLLEALSSAPQRVLTREQLLDLSRLHNAEVWLSLDRRPDPQATTQDRGQSVAPRIHQGRTCRWLCLRHAVRLGALPAASDPDRSAAETALTAARRALVPSHRHIAVITGFAREWGVLPLEPIPVGHTVDAALHSRGARTAAADPHHGCNPDRPT